MTRLARAFLLAALAAFALPALADAAPASTRGTIVQRDAATGTVVVASSSGVLHRMKVASPGHLQMGALVNVRGSKIKVLGQARSAKVRGLVMRSSRHSYALAGNGAVVGVTTPTPPAAGQQVTATVQVTPTELTDDDGDEQVTDSSAPSAELHGTVLSQDAKTLKISVPGFPAGLSIALGTQTIPVLPVGTPIEARVTIGPDPLNPAAILLTLLSLHVQNGGNNQTGGEHGTSVKAEGQVTALTEAGPVGGAPGSITVLDEHGPVTFVIPAGFGPTGAVVGGKVEAKGTASTTPGGNPTLVKLEGSGVHQHNDSGDSGDSGDSDDEQGNSNSGATTRPAIPANGQPGSSGGHDNSSGGDD
jgi:hypothetical protein